MSGRDYRGSNYRRDDQPRRKAELRGYDKLAMASRHGCRQTWPPPEATSFDTQYVCSLEPPVLYSPSLPGGSWESQSSTTVSACFCFEKISLHRSRPPYHRPRPPSPHRLCFGRPLAVILLAVSIVVVATEIARVI